VAGTVLERNARRAAVVGPTCNNMARLRMATHGRSLCLVIVPLIIHRERSYAGTHPWKTPMRKTLIALLAIVSIGGLVASPAVASARGETVWQAGYRWHGANWWGNGYAPYYGYGGCYFVRQRFWNGYGWRSRAVHVCG
jgi:hypothetical protein